MLFFATRCSDRYFRALEEVRNETAPHTLICGNTGLEFLQAVGDCTDEINICDLDPAVLHYNEVILRLICESSSLSEFISFLTGHETLSLVPLRIGNPMNCFPDVWKILRNASLYAMYIGTIGRMAVSAESSSARFGDSHILFSGKSLEPLHYAWRFGEGAFAGEDSFRRLKVSLSHAKIRYRRCPLHDFPWSSIDSASKVIFLSGNTESPLYHRGDPMIQTIARSAKSPVRYLSWRRNLSFASANGLPDEISELISKVKGTTEFYGLGFEAPENCQTFYNLKDLQQANLFGAPLLVIDIDQLEPEDANIERLVTTIAPCFYSVIFFGEGRGAELIQRADGCSLFDSYEIRNLTQNRGYFFLHLELKH